MAIVGASVVGGAIEAAGIVPADPGVSDLGADGTEWDQIWAQQVFVSADAGQANAAADDLVIGTTAGAARGATLLQSAGIGYWAFGRASAALVGALAYDHSLDTMYQRTNNAARIQTNGSMSGPVSGQSLTSASATEPWTVVYADAAQVNNAAGTANAAADDLVVGTTGGAGASYGLTVLSDATGVCTINLGDSDDDDAAGLSFNHSSAVFSMRWGGAERLRGNGQVLFPPVTNTFALGSTSLRWSNVFSITLDRNADILAGSVTPSALSSGSNDDVSITNLHTYNIVRLTADSANSTLTSIVVGSVAAGQVFMVSNEASTGDLILAHDDGATGTAANRFYLANNANITVRPRGCFLMWYDGTASRWRVR